MKIWILNHYAANMFFNGTGRHQSFAKYMIKYGYDVTIFSANTLHNTKTVIDTGGELYVDKMGKDNVPYVFVKTRRYSGNGVGRIKNIFDFYFRVKRTMRRCIADKGGPDIILASSVHLLTLVAGLQFAKKIKCKCICEIRDLWPESIIAFTKVTRNNIIVRLLYMLEKWIYREASALIFTMEGGKQYILDKKWEDVIDLEKIHHINNGVDLEVFNKNKEQYKFERRKGSNTEKINIVYAGSIRKANNVKNLAYIAKALKERKIDGISIDIYGDGPDKEEIEAFIREYSLENIHMIGKVDKKYIPSILSQPNNINCLNYKYSDIFLYGGSQNKLFEYLASGNPVISNIRMGYDIVEKYRAGVVVGSDNLEDWIKTIIYLKNLDTKDYIQMCNNAKKASKDYDYKSLTDRVIKVVESL